MTTRATFDIAGRTLSYLDFGGTGRPLLALHGHMSDAESFTGLAQRLAPGWRLIALDQRGHGYSDRPADYSREGYVADVLALLDHLDLERAVLLGHSVGGLNAYQLAAWHPERVEAIINADMAVSLGLDGANPFEFLRTLPYEAATRQQLIDEMGPLAAHFGALVRERADGTWSLPFHPLDIIDSEDQVHGDHWADWLAGTCPALIIRGSRGAIPADQARAMADQRPHTRLVELDTDHFVYTNDPDGFAKAVNEFLDQGQ
ncbi:pimeloyl-ACP methyl ester carboxylesterase [Nocardia transvalensis]|uniref:Pimeloyl-ACP methyl ester carboxylesterase n=1 Tax=Nocardia transvalensis TaxID=37333 RepID=A0A7W9ULL3_9NOCA|nr:alpha/beta hydrolase [Nocardia transvalensis]MBB5917659.1 pimeloyl-ACP methyl ester carboxylesterase [Nocardia transvalensis]